jgi:quinol monooxygenase YgiN
MRDFRLADREVSNLQLATYNLMDPLLAKIRAQLPSETLSFALIVRGEVLKEQLLAFTKLARATQESTQKEPGNLLYRFFFDAQDPLEYVLLESWENFPALVAHFETGHFKQFAQGTESLTGERFSVEVLLTF